MRKGCLYLANGIQDWILGPDNKMGRAMLGQASAHLDLAHLHPCPNGCKFMWVPTKLRSTVQIQ